LKPLPKVPPGSVVATQKVLNVKELGFPFEIGKTLGINRVLTRKAAFHILVGKQKNRVASFPC
jgi:hypothetical protein